MPVRSFFSQLGRLLSILVLSPLIVAAISFARWNLDEVLGEKAPYGLYIFGVILASQLLGFSAGLLTTILSAAAGTFLFLADKNGIVNFEQSEIFRILLFLAEGLAISISAELLLSSRARANRRENDLRIVTDHMPAVIAYVDSQEKYRFANKAFFDAFAIEPDSVIGKNSREFLSESEYSKVEDYIRRALKGERVEYETDLLLNNGNTVCIKGSYIPDISKKGKVRGYFALVVDVTERYLSELAAKTNEAEKQRISDRLQLALESTQMGTWELNPASGSLFWDKRSRELFGLAPDEPLTRELFLSLLHPEDRDHAEFENQQAMLPSVGRVSCEYRAIHPVTGKLSWLQSQGKTRFDSEGRPTLLIGTLVDITQRRSSETALRQSQERLTLALESARMGSWHWDIESGVLTASARASEMAGVTDLGGDFFAAMDRVIHPEDIEQVKEKLAEALGTDGRFSEEYRVHRPGGGIGWILSRGQASFDATGRPLSMTGLLIDITDRKLSETALIRAKEEAERASQMKSAFLANMSHEIRTPLGAMLGFASFLKDADLPPEERNKYVDVLTRNGEQLAYLIDDILDFSKVAAGHVQYEILPTKPAQIVEDVVGLLGVKAKEKNLELTFKLDESMPDRVGTDPTRLKQILFNIVGNAVKFTSEGGVHIRVYGSETINGADQVGFEIIDTGIGISAEQGAALFQPFTQADESMTRKFGGTGLGLALSRSLAQGLGGDVVLLASAINQGSKFLITVGDQPVPQTQLHSRARTVAPAASPTNVQADFKDLPLQGLKLLLVEDAEDNRFLISRMITKRGGMIDVAHDGAEGVEKAMRGQYDLVLMDIQMPVMDGYAATQNLRRLGYRQPIIALTAHAMLEARSRTLEAGCTDHLTKPVNAVDLVSVVLRHAGKKVHLDLDLNL